jgi:hypothetical protein
MYFTIKKEKWDKVERYYINEISKHFLYQPLTPSTILRMQSFLEHLQKTISYREKDLVWQIKPKLLFDIPTQNFGIEPDLENGKYKIE